MLCYLILLIVGFVFVVCLGDRGLVFMVLVIRCFVVLYIGVGFWWWVDGLFYVVVVWAIVFGVGIRWKVRFC